MKSKQGKEWIFNDFLMIGRESWSPFSPTFVLTRQQGETDGCSC